MKKYIFLTNIPTPYRTSFYNDLHNHKLDFEVFYMRHAEADRSWNIDPGDLKHPHLIDKGFYKMLGRFHVHFNPRIILEILRSKKSEIVVGGAWNDLDVLAIAVLKRVGILRNQLHFWSEANYLTIGASNDNFIKKILRKFVYHSSTGAQLSSGAMTEITLVEKWGIKCNSFVPLPNTIEEDKFQISQAEIEERYNYKAPSFIMPVRLLEQDKGILNFFRSIGNENIKKAIFNIAGNGPDKEKIQTFINENDLGNHINLLGYCNTEKMVSLYKKSNGFVLPSFSDPSPLSLIEAIRMKLPVLVSERCGNHFEAVINTLNGYVFDPLTPESVKTSFEKFLERSTEWYAMGEKSEAIYQDKFKKEMVISNFVKALTNLPNS